MKTTKLILFGMICLFGFCHCIKSQDSKPKEEQYTELSVNGKVYIYDPLTHKIRNKNNHIYKINEHYYCESHVKVIKSYDEIFDKIFSTEREKELKGLTLPMVFYCNSSGNILEVDFRVKDISMISVQEINALETELLKYKFELSDTCPEKKYYLVMGAYRGWL